MYPAALCGWASLFEKVNRPGSRTRKSHSSQWGSCSGAQNRPLRYRRGHFHWEGTISGKYKFSFSVSFVSNRFFPILVNIIVNITWSVIGQVLFPTNVNEEPHIFSQVVYHTELHQNIEVLGNVPYYFEVEIQDESSGCRYAGCVSESSISLMESEEKWIGLE